MRNMFLAVAAIGTFLALSLAAQRTAQPPTARAEKNPATASSRKIDDKVANSYVDPAWCAQCHAEIAKTYALTGMGRSFSKVASQIAERAPQQPYFHGPSQSYFSIIERDGSAFERRWQIGFDGKETNVEEKQIDYVLGSGNHARTYLHLTARNTLEQLPFGWYAENGGTWAMIPGFDRPDYPGSTRQVQYECMFCHNGYPRIPAANTEEGAEAVYQQPLPVGIDCQRCHGPGQRHLDTVSKTNATPEEIRASIVNPARLGPVREMEVCMQCHLETSSLLLPHSIQRVGRGPFSYIPGQPLADFRLSFDRAPGKNTRFEVASAAYRLRESQCFLQTQKRDPSHQLTCTTCHDPHDIPRGEQASEHYNAVCGSCHTTELVQVAVKAGSHPSGTDCVSCHMPKRRTDDAIHIVMTDHLIQKRPPSELLTAKTEYYESPATSYKGIVALYYPPAVPETAENQLDIAAAQVKDVSNLRAGISQLNSLLRKYRPSSAAYYVDFADALHAAGASTQSSTMYEEALSHAPSSPTILLKIGRAQLDWQQWPEAETTLRRATDEAPNDPLAWSTLGQALFQQGKDSEAKEALTKAVDLDPDAAEPHNYLGALYVRANDLAGAEQEFRKALTVEPNVAEWQANLAGLLAGENKVPEARYLFELSIRLDPKLASARINYARLLASTGDDANAETQATATAEIEPKNAVAHEILGYLLASRGDASGAVRELQSAVSLQPDFWEAHLELGAALRMAGDTEGAQKEFKIAASGTDPQVRAEAARLEGAGR